MVPQARTHHVVENVLGLQVGKVSLHALTSLDTHLMLCHRQNHENTVIEILFTNSPGLEGCVGNVLDVRATEVRKNEGSNLIGAALVNHFELVIQALMSNRRKD